MSGATDEMVNSLTFTRDDGMEIVCGAPGEGFAFAPVNGQYLIGVDGHFSEYLDGIDMKTMPEA